MREDINLSGILAQVEQGDPVGAAYRLSQDLRHADDASRILYEAGSVALEERDELGEQALRFARLVFAEAVEKDPDFGEAHHDLATTMRELGMAEDAVVHYKRALELLPNDADCLIGLGAALCDAERLPEAVVALENACQTHPDSGTAFANLGIALEAMGKDDDAARAYARSVTRFDAQLLDIEDEDIATEVMARRRFARIQYAEVLERLGRTPQAIVEYRRLYEEEQAAMEEEAAGEIVDDDGEDMDDDELIAEPYQSPEPGQDFVGEQLTATMEEVPPEEPAEDATEEHEVLAQSDETQYDEAEEAGRAGLERIFARLVVAGRLELAYLILDELGGEISDRRAEKTYSIHDAGEGHPHIVVERWSDRVRESLDPTPLASVPAAPPNPG